MIDFGKCKITESYPPETPPTRPGVYMTSSSSPDLFGSYLTYDIVWVFQYWNGKYWGRCVWDDDWAEESDNVIDIRDVVDFVVEHYSNDKERSIYQENYWRGISNGEAYLMGRHIHP